MNTAEQLYEKYKQDLSDLQAKCTHPEVSDWIMEYWAPAHATGYDVKVCKVCNSTIDRKRGFDFDIQLSVSST